MKPKIVEKEGFTIIGMKYEGNNECGEIPLLWQRLNERLNEINNKTIPTVSYGYDAWTEKIKETGEFTYIAGVEVTDNHDIPEGMVCLKVPKSKYAVFTIDSIIEDVGMTVGKIYSKYLPESGLLLADNYDFEYYKHDFQPNDVNSKIYFYVPIK